MMRRDGAPARKHAPSSFFALLQFDDELQYTLHLLWCQLSRSWSSDFSSIAGSASPTAIVSPLSGSKQCSMPVTSDSGDQQKSGQGLVLNAVTEDLLPNLQVP